MSTPEETLATFVADLEYGDVPDGARETIRRAFVDTVGVTLAGAVADAGERTRDASGVRSSELPVLLGLAGEDAPAERALRVGTASHALDYDDLAWALDGHPSVTLVPPVLALAAETDADGEDLLAAYAAGFEVECAVAEPISPDHYERGWHATATFGTFGATAAAASLLDLDAAATRRALNTAASMPAGLKRNFGSMTKPLHAGLCSRSGVTAALLAAEDHTADPRAISGDRGFWDLYGDPEPDDFELGDDWTLETEGIHVKFYPCCYFTHTSIAAAQALSEEHDIQPGDVERVEVRAAQGAGDALHHADPETGLEAKFSMEYTVASGLVRDRVGLDAFEDDALDHPDVQRVRERVDFAVDDSLHYDSHEARVRVETGTDSYERVQENPPGTHDDPLSAAQLRAKFTECAERVLPADTADRLYEALAALDEHEDVAGRLADP